MFIYDGHFFLLLGFFLYRRNLVYQTYLLSRLDYLLALPLKSDIIGIKAQLISDGIPLLIIEPHPSHPTFIYTVYIYATYYYDVLSSLILLIIFIIHHFMLLSTFVCVYKLFLCYISINGFFLSIPIFSPLICSDQKYLSYMNVVQRI